MEKSNWKTCYNQECIEYNMGGKCMLEGATNCVERKLKTPTYAEEQLENAQDNTIKALIEANKEFKDSLKIAINEAELLKKENEENRDHISNEIKMIKEERKFMEEEADTLRTKLTEYEIHIDKLNKVADLMETQNTDLKETIKTLAKLI